MGFYLRKSVRVGPLRFNLSKSGIGVSAGIPGFRIGMGPRGNYVHAGAGGIYYRASLPSAGRPAPARTPAPRGLPVGGPAPAGPTIGPAEDIESGSVLQMTDHSAEGLLAELNAKRRRARVAPPVGLLLILGGIAVWHSLPTAGQFLYTVVAGCVAAAAYQWDLLRKSTVVMYDLDSNAAESYQRLVAAVQAIGQAQQLWHVDSRAAVLDRKYHAGADSEITRKTTAVALGQPPFVKTNLDVPSIDVGRQTLYFFPDRLLVFDSDSVGAVSYGHLTVEQQTVRFIESAVVPGDARVVDRTWRYVNKNGTPDRRFRDNREIPICEYEAIHFHSRSGLNELLHASRQGVSDAIRRYLLAAPGRRTGR